MDHDTIQCTKCHTEKSQSDFRKYRGRGSKWYTRSECKDCEKLLDEQLREAWKTAPPPPAACECCGTALYKPVLDHDHETGQFRGWLCRTCNDGLGKFKDTVEGVGQAYNYLLRKRFMSEQENEKVKVTVEVELPKTTRAPVVEGTESGKTLLLEEIEGLDRF